MNFPDLSEIDSGRPGRPEPAARRRTSSPASRRRASRCHESWAGAPAPLAHVRPSRLTFNFPRVRLGPVDSDSDSEAVAGLSAEAGPGPDGGGGCAPAAGLGLSPAGPRPGRCAHRGSLGAVPRSRCQCLHSVTILIILFHDFHVTVTVTVTSPGTVTVTVPVTRISVT